MGAGYKSTSGFLGLAAMTNVSAALADEPGIGPTTRGNTAASVAKDGGQIDFDNDAQGDIESAAVLSHRLERLQFNKNSFADVIDYMRDQAAASLNVDWKALAQAGIDRDSPVTTRLKNVTLGTSLDVILNIVSSEVALSYVLEDGTILITTTDSVAN